MCIRDRQVFDDYVMKNILEGDEEKQPLDAYRLSQGKRRLLAQNTIQPIAVPPGSWQNVASQTSSTSVANQSLVARLKQELGIK